MNLLLDVVSGPAIEENGSAVLVIGVIAVVIIVACILIIRKVIKKNKNK